MLRPGRPSERHRTLKDDLLDEYSRTGRNGNQFGACRAYRQTTRLYISPCSKRKVANRKRRDDVLWRGQLKDVDKEGEDAGKPAAAKAKAKKGKDNPYASRGLDKFSTVLSELESRRERILCRAGPDVDVGHLMVRFVQSEGKGWVPVVVKLPSEEEQAAADAKKKQSKKAKSTSRPDTPPTEPGSPKEDAAKHVAPAVKAAVPAKKKKAGGSGERWSWSSGKVVRPCHYWPLALVLLLLSLVVFGRVFAICCTSIWWYLLPILSGDESRGATRLPAAKTRMSGKVAAAAAAPVPLSHGKKSSSGAAHEVISPRSHANRNKG